MDITECAIESVDPSLFGVAVRITPKPGFHGHRNVSLENPRHVLIFGEESFIVRTPWICSFINTRNVLFFRNCDSLKK